MKQNIYFALAIFAVIGFSACAEKTSSETVEKTFTKIDIKDLSDNAVSLFADNWFVVTAGNDSVSNPMTISWGALGNVWQSPAVTIYIRHSRHTFGFLNDNNYFTLCAFDEEYREKVQYIGQKSGRDGDKIAATGLTPIRTELGSVYYEEARLVIECEKVYAGDINPADILDENIKAMYDDGNEHCMFIGRIVNVWEKK